MTKETLSEALRFLKKHKVQKGDVAEKTGIRLSYLSNMLNPEGVLTRNFIEVFEKEYGQFLKDNGFQFVFSDKSITEKFKTYDKKPHVTTNIKKNKVEEEKTQPLKEEILSIKKDGEKVTIEIVLEMAKNTTGLIAVTKTTAEATDKVATAHLKQTVMLENLLSSGVERETRAKEEQTEFLLNRIAAVGVPQLWESMDQGQRILSKLLSEYVPALSI